MAKLSLDMLRSTFDDFDDVGSLTVKVHRAVGLTGVDFGGKSDPFCVLELEDTKYQTQTEHKTLSPTWLKTFTFNIKDINSVLHVTVFNEKGENSEFLGQVLIPLLRICNGEQRWYSLKDKDLLTRAKGNSPMILLEMNIVWNPIRACLKTINPKDEYRVQEEIKFRVPVFVKNVRRLKAIIKQTIQWGRLIRELCEWETPGQNAVALVVYIAICHYFKPYMLMAILLFIFLKNFSQCEKKRLSHVEEALALVDEDEEFEDKEKEGRKPLRVRLHEIQEVTQTVQNAIGNIASLGEQVKNTFNFTVPFVSYLAMGLVIAAMFTLYFMPFRYLIMSIGVYKFARKILRPDIVPNNEILDLLSRVPDDEELVRYREIRPNLPRDNDGRQDQRKKQPK